MINIDKIIKNIDNEYLNLLIDARKFIALSLLIAAILSVLLIYNERYSSTIEINIIDRNLLHEYIPNTQKVYQSIIDNNIEELNNSGKGLIVKNISSKDVFKLKISNSSEKNLRLILAKYSKKICAEIINSNEETINYLTMKLNLNNINYLESPHLKFLLTIMNSEKYPVVKSTDCIFRIEKYDRTGQIIFIFFIFPIIGSLFFLIFKKIKNIK